MPEVSLLHGASRQPWFQPYEFPLRLSVMSFLLILRPQPLRLMTALKILASELACIELIALALMFPPMIPSALAV